MQELTDANFAQEVLEADGPVVVDFWAPWCGPCRAVEPIFRELEQEHGQRVKFGKLDIDQNLETAAHMNYHLGFRCCKSIGPHPQ